jgi:hypothetical protein
MLSCKKAIEADEVIRVPQYIRDMKRLWVGKGLNGLLLRREEEACLVELGLKACNKAE